MLSGYEASLAYSNQYIRINFILAKAGASLAIIAAAWHPVMTQTDNNTG
jgi:hypothetical protein